MAHCSTTLRHGRVLDSAFLFVATFISHTSGRVVKADPPSGAVLFKERTIMDWIHMAVRD